MSIIGIYLFLGAIFATWALTHLKQFLTADECVGWQQEPRRIKITMSLILVLAWPFGVFWRWKDWYSR